MPSGVGTFIPSSITAVLTPIDCSPRHFLLESGCDLRDSVCTIPQCDGRGGMDPTVCLVSRNGVDILHPPSDPLFHIPEPIPEVSACFEAGWALTAVPPCVEGGYRHVQVIGELFDCQQLVELNHGRIMDADPFNPMSSHDQSSTTSGRQRPVSLEHSMRRYSSEKDELEGFERATETLLKGLLKLGRKGAEGRSAHGDSVAQIRTGAVAGWRPSEIQMKGLSRHTAPGAPYIAT